MTTASPYDIVSVIDARHNDLRRLAEIDSARPLEAPALVAYSDDEAIAALSLADGRVAANPFRRTAAAVTTLRTRAEAYGFVVESSPSLRERILAALRPVAAQGATR
jgi:hypothetical protein